MQEYIKIISELPDEKKQMAKELDFSYAGQMYLCEATQLLETLEQWKKQGLFQNLVRVDFSECSYLKYLDEEYTYGRQRIDDAFTVALAKVLELGIYVDITASRLHDAHISGKEWVEEFFEWAENSFEGRIDKHLLVWKHPDQLEREIFGWLR